MIFIGSSESESFWLMCSDESLTTHSWRWSRICCWRNQALMNTNVGFSELFMSRVCLAIPFKPTAVRWGILNGGKHECLVIRDSALTRSRKHFTFRWTDCLRVRVRSTVYLVRSRRETANSTWLIVFNEGEHDWIRWDIEMVAVLRSRLRLK